MKKMRPSDCGADDYSSDDEISVGCPSPQHQAGVDEEMEESKNAVATKETLLLTSQHTRPEENAETSSDAAKNASGGGVRSFSILDILNHRPSQQPPTPQRSTPAPESSPVCSAAKIRRKSSTVETATAAVVDSPHHPPGLANDADSPTKIMRPWDYPHLTLPAHFQAAAAAAAGFLNPNRCLPFVAHPAGSPFLPGPHPFGLQSHPAAGGLGFHPHHHHHPNFHHHHHHQRAAGSSFVGGILSVGGSSSGHLSPSSSSASPDYISAGGSSDCDADDVCSTSGNSATSAGSPLLQQQQRQKTLLNSGTLVVNNNNTGSGSARKSSSSAPSSGHHHHKKSSGESGKSAGAANSAGGTPLDALFQMTSKTFDGSSNNGADSSGSQTGSGHGGGGGGGGGNGGALFSPRQQAKKKRKSRTAFTNHQIFELEKRFLYQKYLSPADRDEIALTLGLTNAQVITWFQNRRAKLKRDMEELKKDVESAKILGSHHHHHHHHHHKAFIGAMDLNLLQKKADEYNQAIAAASD